MLFSNQFREFQVFSVADAKKAFPGFDSRRLVEWQDKGYLKKLVNKWYLLSEAELTEHLSYRISNCIYHPSYVSLESALAHYHFIPEAVYTVQAVSTKKTASFNTPAGNFAYRTVKPALYFGYSILKADGPPALLAEPEKALLDFLYLNARLKSTEDIEAVRFNWQEIRQAINMEKLLQYAKVYDSAALNKRIALFKKLLLNADID